MSSTVFHTILSVVGPPMKGDNDPIYEVALHFPPIEILVFASDEPPPKGRDTTQVNFNNITDHFNRTRTKVTTEMLILENFEDNVYYLATKLISCYQKNPERQLVIDLSAGRGSIRQALSRAADVAIEVIQNYFDPEVYIIAAIRSRKKPVLSYKIGKTAVPNKKDAELLLNIEEELTQTALARKLGWNNQSEVSKGVQRLVEDGLVENLGHKTRKLTKEGNQIATILKNINIQVD